MDRVTSALGVPASIPFPITKDPEYAFPLPVADAAPIEFWVLQYTDTPAKPPVAVSVHELVTPVSESVYQVCAVIVMLKVSAMRGVAASSKAATNAEIYNCFPEPNRRHLAVVFIDTPHKRSRFLAF
jgi:hypothetical protein